MYRKIDYHIRGLTPCMFHNAQLANPLNEYTKAIKRLTSKRVKTDDDIQEKYHLEFLGGFYLDDKKQPAWPGVNIEAMLLAAAKKNKLGKQFTAGLFSDGNWPLIYDGPKDPEKLWEDERFRDIRTVGMMTGTTIMRCRPIFPKWELKFSIAYLPSLLNEEQISEALTIASVEIGLSDYRPKFGRFEII